MSSVNSSCYKITSLDPYNIDKEALKLLIRNLSDSLAYLKIEEYFNVKPTILNESDYITVAQNAHNIFIAVLASKIYLLNGLPILHIRTIFIGEDYQGTKLFNMVWHNHFSQIIAKQEDFPKIIALKTYNPISYSLMLKIADRANAVFYPRIGISPKYLGEQKQQIIKLAKVIDKNSDFDVDTGVYKNGALNVPHDFYKGIPNISNKEIMEYFLKNLTAADRLLCCLFCEDIETQEKVIRQFKPLKEQI